MTKPHFRLRVVKSMPQPANKLAAAIAWLRARDRYVLDAHSRRPAWGIPFSLPEESALMKAVMEADRRRR